jgi:hypothetical protein
MRLTKNEIQTESAGHHGDLRRSDLNLHNLPLKYLSYNKDLSEKKNSGPCIIWIMTLPK